MIFSRTRFSRKSTHRIFLVVVPLDHAIAPWLSFLIMDGEVSGIPMSRKSNLYSNKSFVVSLILWTSTWQDDCAVSLCRAHPQAIGAPAFIMNHPDRDRRELSDCSFAGSLGFGMDASIGPQFASQYACRLDDCCVGKWTDA